MIIQACKGRQVAAAALCCFKKTKKTADGHRNRRAHGNGADFFWLQPLNLLQIVVLPLSIIRGDDAHHDGRLRGDGDSHGADSKLYAAAGDVAIGGRQ